MNVLHVLNYGWPYIDGYTARSIGLTNAQALHLEGVDIAIAVSPFTPLAHGRDPAFTSDYWGPDQQLHATRHRGDQAVPVRSWERPALGISMSTSAMFAAELISIARRLDIELIHVHHPHYVAATALQVANELDLPAVYELRCFNGYYDLGTINPFRTARGHWQNHLEFRLAREASAVVTISDGQAATLARRGVATDRLHVVRNSVDTSRFTPARAAGCATGADSGSVSRASTLRGPAEVHGRRLIRVGYATTFETMENLDSAVRAAAIAHRRLLDEGIHLELVLAGTGRDWPRIQSIVEAEGLGDHVLLPGLIPYRDMPDFYRSLDLFLVPRGDSLVATDTTPLKPLEALACGIPLLATGIPAMRELLAHRSDVRFTEVDASSMANDLIEFARHPWSGGGDVSERAWASEVQRYHAVYSSACRQGPPRPGRRRRLVMTSTGALQRLPSRARGALASTQDRLRSRQLVGRSVDTTSVHVVLCGFPRTGSTLLQLMTQCCLTDVRTFEGEVEALDVIGSFSGAGRLLTKCPDDIYRVDEIADAYAQRPDARAEFLLTVRDPRDILTSRHAAYTRSRGYYVSAERMLAQWQAVQAIRQREDACIIRYETLVDDPYRVQSLFAERLGWNAATDFARYHEKAVERPQDSMTTGALGGIRVLDTGRLSRWKAPEHAERVRQLLLELPELPAMCIDLGYESSEQWTADYRQSDGRNEGSPNNH